MDDLLSLIPLIAEMEGFKGNPEETASGFVLEAHLDSKRGIVATLIIKNGSLTKGMTVVVLDAICSTRIIENYKGEAVDSATFSSPIRIFGFNKIPKVGSEFMAFKNKKDAEEYIENEDNLEHSEALPPLRGKVSGEEIKKIIPILLKADVAGTLEAIEKEINKITAQNAEFKIVGRGIGPICESDIKNISDSTNIIVIGFNVKGDKSAIEMAQNREIKISFFDIIYKMTEWLTEQMEKLRPRVETIETTGRAKIIRAFSRTKERQIVGGKVLEGKLAQSGTIKIMRREFEIGRGKIVNLEKTKVKTSIVEEGNEFGMMVESKIEIVAGDVIESFNVVQK